jgi:DNA-binding NtrC family response regulator
MILIIESDTTVRKKLSDLLSRERIIGIDSVQQMLEMLCKFRNNLNLIVADIHQLHEIISKKVVFRLCEKLHIDTPPVVGIYKDGDEKIKEEFEKNNIGYKLLKYNDKDCSFPEQYIETIKEVYPGVHADVEKAREIWLEEKENDDLVDIRKWVEEEGFLEIIDKIRIGESEKKVNAGKSKTKRSSKDYKKLYFEIKQKYDELLKYVKELADSV